MEPKQWYKKKKYVLPVLAIAGVMAFSSRSDTTQTQIAPSPVSIQVPTSNTLERASVPIQGVPTSAPVEEETHIVEEAAIEHNCHPSYSGCLNPAASDYDCIGGSGNGPYYTEVVQVIGSDVFDLDRDGDGWGCE
jgi:resuscitation-promoting factor RpfB